MADENQNANADESTTTDVAGGIGEVKVTFPEIPKTFSQEDVNRIMATARKEEAAKFPDYAKFKADADKLENIRHEQLSENDKLKEATEAAEKTATDATAKLGEAQVANEIGIKAMQKGFIDPGDALALIDRTGISLEETGIKGVDDALDSLLASKPHLKALVGAPNLNPGGNRTPEPVQLTDAERATAKHFGVSDENYARNKPNPG